MLINYYNKNQLFFVLKSIKNIDEFVCSVRKDNSLIHIISAIKYNKKYTPPNLDYFIKYISNIKKFNIKRVIIVYENHEYSKHCPLLLDLNDNRFFSKDCIELFRHLKKTFSNLESVDLLTCNLKHYDIFNDIEKELNLDIRYSVNVTGNVDVGGDWIYESHGVDIKELYFNNNIDKYPNHFLFEWLKEKLELLSDTANLVLDTIAEDVVEIFGHAASLVSDIVLDTVYIFSGDGSVLERFEQLGENFLTNFGNIIGVVARRLGKICTWFLNAILGEGFLDSMLDKLDSTVNFFSIMCGLKLELDGAGSTITAADFLEAIAILMSSSDELLASWKNAGVNWFKDIFGDFFAEENNVEIDYVLERYKEESILDQAFIRNENDLNLETGNMFDATIVDELDMEEEQTKADESPATTSLLNFLAAKVHIDEDTPDEEYKVNVLDEEFHITNFEIDNLIDELVIENASKDNLLGILNFDYEINDYTNRHDAILKEYRYNQISETPGEWFVHKVQEKAFFFIKHKIRDKIENNLFKLKCKKQNLEVMSSAAEAMAIASEARENAAKVAVGVNVMEENNPFTVAAKRKRTQAAKKSVEFAQAALESDQLSNASVIAEVNAEKAVDTLKDSTSNNITSNNATVNAAEDVDVGKKRRKSLQNNVLKAMDNREVAESAEKAVKSKVVDNKVWNSSLEANQPVKESMEKAEKAFSETAVTSLEKDALENMEEISSRKKPIEAYNTTDNELSKRMSSKSDELAKKVSSEADELARRLGLESDEVVVAGKDGKKMKRTVRRTTGNPMKIKAALEEKTIILSEKTIKKKRASIKIKRTLKKRFGTKYIAGHKVSNRIKGLLVILQKIVKNVLYELGADSIKYIHGPLYRKAVKQPLKKMFNETIPEFYYGTKNTIRNLNKKKALKMIEAQKKRLGNKLGRTLNNLEDLADIVKAGQAGPAMKKILLNSTDAVAKTAGKLGAKTAGKFVSKTALKALLGPITYYRWITSFVYHFAAETSKCLDKINEANMKPAIVWKMRLNGLHYLTTTNSYMFELNNRYKAQNPTLYSSTFSLEDINILEYFESNVHTVLNNTTSSTVSKNRMKVELYPGGRGIFDFTTDVIDYNTPNLEHYSEPSIKNEKTFNIKEYFSSNTLLMVTIKEYTPSIGALNLSFNFFDKAKGEAFITWDPESPLLEVKQEILDNETSLYTNLKDSLELTRKEAGKALYKFLLSDIERDRGRLLLDSKLLIVRDSNTMYVYNNNSIELTNQNIYISGVEREDEILTLNIDEGLFNGLDEVDSTHTFIIQWYRHNKTSVLVSSGESIEYPLRWIDVGYNIYALIVFTDDQTDEDKFFITDMTIPITSKKDEVSSGDIGEGALLFGLGTGPLATVDDIDLNKLLIEGVAVIGNYLTASIQYSQNMDKKLKEEKFQWYLNLTNILGANKPYFKIPNTFQLNDKISVKSEITFGRQLFTTHKVYVDNDNGITGFILSGMNKVGEVLSLTINKLDRAVIDEINWFRKNNFTNELTAIGLVDDYNYTLQEWDLGKRIQIEIKVTLDGLESIYQSHNTDIIKNNGDDYNYSFIGIENSINRYIREYCVNVTNILKVQTVGGDQDGDQLKSITYRWVREDIGTNTVEYITGTNNDETYTITNDDKGKYIYVETIVNCYGDPLTITTISQPNPFIELLVGVVGAVSLVFEQVKNILSMEDLIWEIGFNFVIEESSYSANIKDVGYTSTSLRRDVNKIMIDKLWGPTILEVKLGKAIIARDEENMKKLNSLIGNIFSIKDEHFSNDNDLIVTGNILKWIYQSVSMNNI